MPLVARRSGTTTRAQLTVNAWREKLPYQYQNTDPETISNLLVSTCPPPAK